MDEQLYIDNKKVVVDAIMKSHERDSVSVLREASHDAVLQINKQVADAVRMLNTQELLEMPAQGRQDLQGPKRVMVSLEDVLFVLGYRP